MAVDGPRLYISTLQCKSYGMQYYCMRQYGIPHRMQPCCMCGRHVRHAPACVACAVMRGTSPHAQLCIVLRAAYGTRAYMMQHTAWYWMQNTAYIVQRTCTPRSLQRTGKRCMACGMQGYCIHQHFDAVGPAVDGGGDERSTAEAAPCLDVSAGGQQCLYGCHLAIRRGNADRWSPATAWTVDGHAALQ